MIAETCASQSARLVRSDLEVAIASTAEPDLVTFTTRRVTVADVRLALRGVHQVNNAAVAVAVLDELDALGFVDAGGGRSHRLVGSGMAGPSRAIHGRRLSGDR